MRREIYLDNSATTRPYDEVIDYMNEINRIHYGNPSSLHTKGIEAERVIKKAREVIANSMKAESREIFFTSGGTESNNLAIRGYLEANPRKGKHILTTTMEHPAVMEVYKYLSGHGYTFDLIPVDPNGVIQLDALKRLMSEDTAIVSILYINNEIGSIQPLDEIAAIRNSINKETVLHVDGVQAYGKMKILPSKTGIDLLSVSSHKIHGPKGVGALYVSKSIRLKPLLLGGGQESLMRSGTENVPGIAGFGMAAEKITERMETNYEQVTALKHNFVARLADQIENCRIVSPESSSPFILSVSFEGVKAEVLLHHLEERGIYVSTGAACSSRKNVHSHVLKAIGLPPEAIEGTIRFSFSAFNTNQEIEVTVETLKEILPKIQIRRGGRR